MYHAELFGGTQVSRALHKCVKVIRCLRSYLHLREHRVVRLPTELEWRLAGIRWVLVRIRLEEVR
jgi:hypothetical protein